MEVRSKDYFEEQEDWGSDVAETFYIWVSWSNASDLAWDLHTLRLELQGQASYIWLQQWYQEHR